MERTGGREPEADFSQRGIKGVARRASSGRPHGPAIW